MEGAVLFLEGEEKIPKFWGEKPQNGEIPLESQSFNGTPFPSIPLGAWA